MAFVAGALPVSKRTRSARHAICMRSEDWKKPRRAFLRDLASVIFVQVAGIGSSLAAVDFDTDRFGDKELKVSAINKVKQNCRNVLASKPELLSGFFLLGVKDALSYDAVTNSGGPNGSIRFELDQTYNSEIRAAAEALKEVRKLQREDMSYGDTFAFAGATAIEVSGGPRVKVQLGREDASEADPPGQSALFASGSSADQLRKCFDSAGLDGAKSVVLIHGALGSLADIANVRAQELAAQSIEDEDEDLEDVTYGKVATKNRGAVLVETNVATLTLGGGKFSNKYLGAILKAKPSELSDRDKVVLDDPALKAEVALYAKDNNKFKNDLADLYQRMTLLGSSFENLKFED